MASADHEEDQEIVPPTEEDLEQPQNIGEGEEAPTGPEFEPDVDDSDLEMIESSVLMGETDVVTPDEEFDVEETGDNPAEDDEEA